MSSIPVKKVGTVTRRSGITRGNVSNENSNEMSSESRGTTKHSGKENKTRPFLRQGSKKELENENTRLNDLIHVHEQKLKDLETKFILAEEELTRANSEVVTIKDSYEKKLLTCNIDPVTLTQITNSEEESYELQQCLEKSRDKVAALKDRMQQLNSSTETCISELEEFSSQLEASSEIS